MESVQAILVMDDYCSILRLSCSSSSSLGRACYVLIVDLRWVCHAICLNAAHSRVTSNLYPAKDVQRS
jgi:hypothetical protein